MKQSSSLGAFTLLWLAGVGLRLTIIAVPPVLALIVIDFNLSGTEVGLLNAIPICIFAVIAVPGSLLIMRVGAVPALITGLFVTAAGSALRGFAVDSFLLYTGTIIMGVGIAVMQPALPPTVRQWVPNRIGFATAIYTNGLTVGEILVVIATAIVLPLFAGSWRADILFWSLTPAIIAIVIFVFQPRRTGPPVVRLGHWMPDWRDPLVWKVGFMMSGVNQLYFCCNAFVPPYLLQSGHSELIHPALTALNVGQLPASFMLLAMASHWERKKWPLFTAALLGLIGITGLLTASTSWQFIAAAASIGFSCAVMLALIFALPALLVAPGDVARLSAGVFTIGYGASMIVSILCGLAWDITRNAAFAFLPIAIAIIPLVLSTQLIDLSMRRSSTA